MEFTLTKTALHTKAIGLKMTRTVKAKNNGLMDLSTKVIMLKARKKAKESLLGLMEASMTETLRGICQMVQVSTLGLTEDDMKEAGKSQRCMVMESTHGQMGESMMEGGWMGSSTVWVTIGQVVGSTSGANGRRARDSGGSPRMSRSELVFGGLLFRKIFFLVFK